jgi:UDP-N-acetylmuramoyl-L-alanyl-D-glutamate--2,6-diaminopimelate ligase
VMLIDSRLTLTGTDFAVEYRGESYRFNSRLVGIINLENLLAAVTLGFSLDLDANIIAQGLAEITVLGRNQVFNLPNGAFAVVDYAHTPDALQRVLASLKPLTSGKLACVFGCGGDRDRTKRPLMGGIAEASADRVYLTSDNPRSEEPRSILTEILSGVKDPSRFNVIDDRRAAIKQALASVAAGDCVLIAGKGHEDYQIVGRVKQHFSDQEEILAWVAGQSTGSDRGA